MSVYDNARMHAKHGSNQIVIEELCLHVGFYVHGIPIKFRPH